MALTYKLLVETVSDVINKSQYFNPLLSWLVVTFIYFSIGIRSDTIWKYLYEVTNWGFYASLFSIIKFVSKNLNYKYMELYRYFVWPETYCFGFNEWGLVYINFIKIRSCIKTLKSKTWNLLIYAFLVYTQICRTIITYHEINEEKQKEDGVKNVEILSVRYHAILYIPMGIFELIFLYLIIKNMLKEKDQKSRSVLNVLLHSTLSRMFIVSLIFFSMSIVVWFDKEGVALLFNRILWRMKGSLSIIYLVDLLLLRIELDTTTVKDISEKLEKANIENSIINSQNNFFYATNTLNSPVNSYVNNSMNSPVYSPKMNYSHHSSNSSFITKKQDVNYPNHIPTSPSNTIGSIRLSTFSTTKNMVDNIPRDSMEFRNSKEMLLNTTESHGNIDNNLYNNENNIREYIYNDTTLKQSKKY
ncbi:hypothetical protein LY90DRAFT_676834 [Neocallimastix californiae]|uniref:Uncharacterized protein n=1 Tax=Neocallimastix californiae TaxID=1754190 RepID=A0A1Y2ACP3_9FUNG|nr:hypothetical protein LY90DRAFT_676834 [Neocallimastix californiae]|eukprot:ORY20276.1 hypothetical protein LY90DRAFT_676834 [Neocallimastix californiae]